LNIDDGIAEMASGLEREKMDYRAARYDNLKMLQRNPILRINQASIDARILRTCSPSGFTN